MLPVLETVSVQFSTLCSYRASRHSRFTPTTPKISLRPARPKLPTPLNPAPLSSNRRQPLNNSLSNNSAPSRFMRIKRMQLRPKVTRRPRKLQLRHRQRVSPRAPKTPSFPVLTFNKTRAISRECFNSAKMPYRMWRRWVGLSGERCWSCFVNE